MTVSIAWLSFRYLPGWRERGDSGYYVVFLYGYQPGHALTTPRDGIGILDALLRLGPARLNLCCFELRNLSNNMFCGPDLECLIMEDVLVRKQAASTLYFAGALMR